MEHLSKQAVDFFGTPIYLYNTDEMSKRIKWLSCCLMQQSGLFFSLKANPIVEIIRNAYESGCGIEVASGGELDLALEAGARPEDIVFTGPGKTTEELEQAVCAGIYIINVESFHEIELIQSIAEKEQKMVSIALRINPDNSVSKSKLQMSGTASQFGIEENDLTEGLFAKIEAMPNISLRGIHIYMGTCILDAEEIYRNTEYAICLGIRLAEQFSFELKYLNAGGGFGIPYFMNDKELDLSRLADGMKILEEKYKGQLSDTKVFFESGRFLLGDCGVFLIRVLYRKKSKEKVYLVCDGGANFHASSAFLGRFVRGNFPMHVLGKSGERREFYVTGPLCTPVDLLGQKVMLPKDTKEGDVIVIEKSGAYGLTYSPYGFLSHKLPMEIGYGEKTGFQILSGEKDG